MGNEASRSKCALHHRHDADGKGQQPDKADNPVMGHVLGLSPEECADEDEGGYGDEANEKAASLV